MSNYGHKFEMFLADDLGLGGFVVNSLTWSMSGIKVARESVSKNSHKELSYAGVYFLLCTGRDGLLESVYIGESLDVKTRLKQHMNDYVKGVEPYFWQYAFCFTDSKLDKSLTLSLESELVALATAYNRTKLLTKQVSNKKVSRGSQVSVRVTLENIRLVLRAFGYSFLDSYHQKDSTTNTTNNEPNVPIQEDEGSISLPKEIVNQTELLALDHVIENNQSKIKLTEVEKNRGLKGVNDLKERRLSNTFIKVAMDMEVSEELEDSIDYYYIKYKSARAICYIEDSKVIVLAGSKVLEETTKRNPTSRRRDYIRVGVLDRNKFMFDTEFSNKSIASSVICLKAVNWTSMYE